MIRRLYSTLSSFKDLSFEPGLNILLAEKSTGASEKHTRNRAGKSSSVELVHFLLGSKAEKESLFRNPALEEHTFGMEFDLAGSFVRIERAGKRASPLVVAGDFSKWPVAPREKDSVHKISNADWREVLGSLMFGVEQTEENWTPSFRSMLSYFARRERSGGFHKPMQQSNEQQVADQQINISYLLGLDWSIPQAWQKVREREKSLEQLRKSLKEGSFGQVIDSASALRTKHVVAQDRLERLKRQVSQFRVVEEYHALEREASSLTRRLSELADENTLDRRYIDELREAVNEEVPPAPKDLQRVYKDAGILLPGLVRKRYDDALVFHESVIRNRQSYLRSEISTAEHRVSEREREQEQLDTRRSEVMNVLRSAGALEHFTALQGETAKTEAEVDFLRQKYDAAKALESGSLRLKMERARLQERLGEDYTEQVGAVEDAILTFQRISSELYEDSKAGTFTVTATENGPEFQIEIQGSKSKGVNNMQIFCFDMMLTLLSLKRGRSPGFLIHDSHLFDGVDERQVGQALALGARLAKEHRFQYIVTMNTDAIPSELPKGFNVDDYTLEVRLSDATETGGLFGFRFD